MLKDEQNRQSAVSLSEISASDSEDERHFVDVRVATINDVFESGSVVYAACRALNHKHGYEETEHALVKTAAIARRCAASVKADTRSIFVATVPRHRKISTFLDSSDSELNRKRSASVQSRDAGLTPHGRSKVNTFVVSHSDPEMSNKLLKPDTLPRVEVPDRPKSKNVTKPKAHAAKHSTGTETLVGNIIFTSPPSGRNSLSTSRDGSQSNSRRSSINRLPGRDRRLSFTPPIKIEGKQGNHKSKIVGVVVVDKRDTVFGVGPIAVHPNFVSNGIGRNLMHTVLEDWSDCKSATFGTSIRLTVEAYNASALSLYVSLGFQIREPLVYVRGNPVHKALPPKYSVRPLTNDDLPVCKKLMEATYGYSRLNELREAIDDGESYPFVVLKERKKKKTIVGYTSTLGVDGHGCTVSTEDMQALIAGVHLYYETNHGENEKKEDNTGSSHQRRESRAKGSKFHFKVRSRSKDSSFPETSPTNKDKDLQVLPPKMISLLVPAHNQHKLLKWCLSSGMKIIKQLSLLSLGDYHPPNKNHVYFPSILY